ncbi:hypothetical protein TSAR_013511 [Trichomalopsis sarcophagae]|uniref:Uncharacterized protein n=1 Tax=Trichomalopsis sarcophagae TaxID=543379 RepID=A0A232EFZ6_9HYME|nr:hypothetical protein TSAR_013511 [Trichomalopsis sarcophagae]
MESEDDFDEPKKEVSSEVSEEEENLEEDEDYEEESVDEHIDKPAVEPAIVVATQSFPCPLKASARQSHPAVGGSEVNTVVANQPGANAPAPHTSHDDFDEPKKEVSSEVSEEEENLEEDEDYEEESVDEHIDKPAVEPAIVVATQSFPCPLKASARQSHPAVGGSEVNTVVANQPGVNAPAPDTNHGLLKYLKKTTIGKEILKAYEKSKKAKGLLPRTVRSKLVRLVITREKDWLFKDINETQKLEKFIITRERFQILANEIAHIFEKESPATYYIPFAQKGKLKSLASGKLWHHYNYTKDCLRRADLLERQSKEIAVHPVTEADIDKINWLLSNLEPWEEVQKKMEGDL